MMELRGDSLARYIKVDGTEQEVKPKNGYEFTLQEMRNYVDGGLEGLRLTDRLHMYLDDEGVLKGKPINSVASDIVSQHKGRPVPVCGDVLIADISETGDE